MMTMMILSILAVIVVLPMVLWLDGVLNKDEFLEVKEWHNFKNKMGGK